MDYDYGQKRQWRRWLWNRLAERTANKADALVLFLAGENALDIEYAAARGFRPRNMIAVERDKKALANLRSLGILAIEGDICDVIVQWSKDKKVAVVLGDFCCGLEESVLLRLREAMTYPSFLDCTFAFNFLRGRDPSFTPLRNALLKQGITEKNRAWHFIGQTAVHIVKRWKGPDEDFAFCLERFEAATAPLFHSYQSTASTQTFDTVVYTSYFGKYFATLEQEPVFTRSSASKAGNAQRRRTAAVLAHHTRRTA